MSRHVVDRHKCLSFGGCSRQTQIPTLSAKMISPACRLPAAPILQVSAIAVNCATNINHRNTAMQFFSVKLTFSIFY
jgi:hypothetical protein